MSDRTENPEKPPEARSSTSDRDGEELYDQSGAQLPRSRTFLAFRFLVQHGIKLVGVVFLLGLVLLFFLQGAGVIDGVQVPRTAKIIIGAVLLLFPFADWVAKQVRDWLWTPNWVYVVDLDARVQDGGVFRWPSQRFRDIDVTEGQLDWLTPQLAVGKNVDLDAGTVEGTWRGTLSDRELLRALHKVRECRDQLEDDAKRGFAIESQAWAIIRNATRSAVRHVIRTAEKGTLPDEGESIGDEIDTAIEQFDIERKIRDAEADDSPESDLPGGDLTLNVSPDGADSQEASADD